MFFLHLQTQTSPTSEASNLKSILQKRKLRTIDSTRIEMCASVCRKRSFVDVVDAPEPWLYPASQPDYKKARCSLSATTAQFTCSPLVDFSPVDQLRALFPDAEIQLLERVVIDSGSDLGLSVRRLHELCTDYSQSTSVPAAEEHTFTDTVPVSKSQAQNNKPVVEASEWGSLIVNEMMGATSIDDAKARASAMLGILLKSISARACTQVDDIQKENSALKEQKEVLARENVILKRAVAIQAERQKENNLQNQEIQQLKQLVAQNQEQLRALEMNNYALKLHLSRTLDGNPMPGPLHPDVL